MTVTETKDVAGQIHCSVLSKNVLCSSHLRECSTAACIQNRLHHSLHIPTHFILNLYLARKETQVRSSYSAKVQLMPARLPPVPYLFYPPAPL